MALGFAINAAFPFKQGIFAGQAGCSMANVDISMLAADYSSGLNLSTLPVALRANDGGSAGLLVGVILQQVVDVLGTTPRGPFHASYDVTNSKLHLFKLAPPTVTLVGGQGAGVAVQIGTDANGAVLGKTTATTRTGITGVQAPAWVECTSGDFTDGDRVQVMAFCQYSV